MISAVDGFLSVMVVCGHDDGQTCSLAFARWTSLRGTRSEFAHCTKTQTEPSQPVNIARIMAGDWERDNFARQPRMEILTLKKPFGLEPISHGVYDFSYPTRLTPQYRSIRHHDGVCKRFDESGRGLVLVSLLGPLDILRLITRGLMRWRRGAGGVLQFLDQGGVPVSESDPWGYKPLDRLHPTQVYDIHATILHQLGLDHTQLTLKSHGIDRRLTDVHGEVIEELVG